MNEQEVTKALEAFQLEPGKTYFVTVDPEYGPELDLIQEALTGIGAKGVITYAKKGSIEFHFEAP